MLARIERVAELFDCAAARDSPAGRHAHERSPSLRGDLGFVRVAQLAEALGPDECVLVGGLAVGRSRVRPGHGRRRRAHPPPLADARARRKAGGRDASPAGRRRSTAGSLRQGRVRRSAVRRAASARAVLWDQASRVEGMGGGHAPGRSLGRFCVSSSRRRVPRTSSTRPVWSCSTPTWRNARASWRRPTGCSTASHSGFGIPGSSRRRGRRRRVTRGGRGRRRRSARGRRSPGRPPAQAVAPLTRGPGRVRFLYTRSHASFAKPCLHDDDESLAPDARRCAGRPGHVAALPAPDGCAPRSVASKHADEHACSHRPPACAPLTTAAATRLRRPSTRCPHPSGPTRCPGRDRPAPVATPSVHRVLVSVAPPGRSPPPTILRI